MEKHISIPLKYNEILYQLNNEDLGLLIKSIFKKDSSNLKNILKTYYNLIIDEVEEESNFVYYITMERKDEKFIKIGYSKNPHKRFSTFRGLGYDVGIIKIKEFYFSNDAFLFEASEHKNYKEYKYAPLLEFGGKEECFEYKIFSKIINNGK